MATLCDYHQRGQTCWGKLLTHKRYGKESDGRDKGKLVEIVASCEGHEEAGQKDRKGLYKPAPEDQEVWTKEDLFY